MYIYKYIYTCVCIFVCSVQRLIAKQFNDILFYLTLVVLIGKTPIIKIIGTRETI